MYNRNKTEVLESPEYRLIMADGRIISKGFNTLKGIKSHIRSNKDYFGYWDGGSQRWVSVPDSDVRIGVFTVRHVYESELCI